MSMRSAIFCWRGETPAATATAMRSPPPVGPVATLQVRAAAPREAAFRRFLASWSESIWLAAAPCRAYAMRPASLSRSGWPTKRALRFPQPQCMLPGAEWLIRTIPDDASPPIKRSGSRGPSWKTGPSWSLCTRRSAWTSATSRPRTSRTRWWEGSAREPSGTKVARNGGTSSRRLGWALSSPSAMKSA